ncbi:MAG: 16S rRNA (uracil(1498)-N(3))-methyltransferase [Thiohalomonadaceae bacterium]|jgi:16S rRNA (uracil1498-N3)-methyltransferase
MQRIYHSTPLAPDSLIELDSAAANHVARVLRLKIGDILTLFNGTGGEYTASVHSINKRRVTVALGQFSGREVESPLAITLAQGIAKGERMDYAIQKATELGVIRIVPLITERCNVRLSDDRWERKLQHWQGVAISACEQCGRNHLPAIDLPRTLTEWLEQDQHELRLTLDPQSRNKLANIKTRPSSASLLVGPEGGLSELELSTTQNSGYLSISLGPRILRSETAGMAALAIMQTYWGDL